MTIEFVESEIAHLGPLLLPTVRHDRPSRPWWEAARLHSMRHYLGEGDRLLDVGAEMGDMSALFASWGVEVFLVEPNPKAWPWISQTFIVNDLIPRVAGWSLSLLGGPAEAALPAAGGETWFRFGGDLTQFEWPDCYALDEDPETGFYHLDEHASVVPAVMTVDELVAETEFVPTAITVDIEGGEIKMIEGMSETLDRHRPKVWMSIHESFIMERYVIPDGGKLIQWFFERHGYDAIFLANDHESHWMFLPKEMGWRW